MYDFYIYAGKNETVEEDLNFVDLQKSAQVVARLCQHSPPHSGHKLFLLDLADMLIALYRISMKTRKWYLKIFWHLIVLN